MFTISKWMLPLAVLSAFAACNRNDAPVLDCEIAVSGTAGAAVVDEGSKTYISDYEGVYENYWSIDDHMKVYFDQVNASRSYILTNNLWALGCSFKGTVSEAEGEHTLYGFYPAEALVAGSENSTQKTVALTIPAVQEPVYGGSDPLADLLVMKPEQKTLSGTSVRYDDVNFARIGAVVKVVVNDKEKNGELFSDNITSLTIRTSSTSITGTARVSLETAAVSSWSATGTEAVAKYKASDYFTVNGTNALFFILKPATIPAGETVEFVLTTDAHTATKKVTLTEPMVFREGKLTVINVRYTADEVEGGDDPQPVTSPKYGKWAEVPAINDMDGNGVDDINSKLYYASHSFSMNNRKYRNYIVCYDAAHVCPLWVSAPRHSVYSGSTGRTDAYAQDPGIPSSVQYKSKSTGGGCNKGHMLGSAERTCCSEANRQVFYYPNIAPQLSTGFNTGGGGWNLLEDWVDTKVCSDTLYIVIGTYFDKYTDGYGYTVSPKTIEFGGRSDVSMPTMFYYLLLRTKTGKTGKNVANCTADELMCAAFVRAHTNSLKGQKPTAKEMMSVADLEKITGQKYFVNVPNAPKDSYKASDWGL